MKRLDLNDCGCMNGERCRIWYIRNRFWYESKMNEWPMEYYIAWIRWKREKNN